MDTTVEKSVWESARQAEVLAKRGRRLVPESEEICGCLYVVAILFTPTIFRYIDRVL